MATMLDAALAVSFGAAIFLAGVWIGFRMLHEMDSRDWKFFPSMLTTIVGSFLLGTIAFVWVLS